MEQIALEGISGDSDPSPAQMAKIVEEIKADNAKCIFYDPIEGDKIANAVAAEAGVEALPLYTFEVDSEDRDYAEIMKFNLEQLKRIK
jgi:zinc transport system substrate-binding protein